MIKAVIFDLDGTLLNTIDDLANSVNFMLKQFGFPTFTVDEYKYKVGNGMRKLIERSLPENQKGKYSNLKKCGSPYFPFFLFSTLIFQTFRPGLRRLPSRADSAGILLLY